jgi:hypothetical protein
MTSASAKIAFIPLPKCKGEFYSALEISGLVYPPCMKGPRHLAVIRCYCDESYDGQSRTYSIAGFVGRDKEWQRLSRCWKNRCLKSGVHVYHSADLEGRHGDSYSHLSPADVKELNTDLISEIVNSKIIGWGTSLIIEDFLAVAASSERAKKVLGPSPYFLVMQVFLVTLCAKVLEDKPNYRIAFIFDQQEEFSGRVKQMYDGVKDRNPNAATCMGTLTYADKKKFIPLQVADKLAYEVMKNMLNIRHDPARKERIALTRMKEGEVIQALSYLDREILSKIVDGQSWL